MDELKAFEVEVAVAATPERVWTALTDPADLRRWHGWDFDGLEAEIAFIYVEHATPFPPHRIELDDGDQSQVVELVPEGERTIVRISRPGPEAAAAEHDVIAEGWRSFLQQMRHYLERQDGAERRTVFLNGEASVSDVADALTDRLPGRPWFADTFQRGIATDDYGGGLAVLASHQPLGSDRAGAVHITLTTHGLDDNEFAAVKDDWWGWWHTLVKAPEVTVRQGS